MCLLLLSQLREVNTFFPLYVLLAGTVSWQILRVQVSSEVVADHG